MLDFFNCFDSVPSLCVITTVTISFSGHTTFAVTGLFGSFPLYLDAKTYNLSTGFTGHIFLVLSVILPIFLPCCLTFFIQPLQLVVLVEPFSPKMASTMLNTSVIFSFLRLVFQVI